MEKKTLKDIRKLQKTFLKQMQEYEAYSKGEKKIPAELLRRERDAFLTPYRERLKVLEVAKERAIERMDKEIEQLKTTIAQLEEDIKSAGKNSGDFIQVGKKPKSRKKG